MPSTTIRPAGRFRRYLWILFAVALALGVIGFLRLATFLVKEDPLQASNAIFVLAGSQMNRPLEAAELYQAGVAKHIVITSDGRDHAAEVLEGKGVHYPAGAELQRKALIDYGIPPTAIIIPARIHDNTPKKHGRSASWRRHRNGRE